MRFSLPRTVFESSHTSSPFCESLRSSFPQSKLGSPCETSDDPASSRAFPRVASAAGPSCRAAATMFCSAFCSSVRRLGQTDREGGETAVISQGLRELGPASLRPTPAACTIARPSWLDLAGVDARQPR
eukprot:3099652-Rhodomonas_salina.1